MKNKEAINIYLQGAREAFELRNISDYDMLGSIEREQALAVIKNAKQFVTRSDAYIKKKGGSMNKIPLAHLSDKEKIAVTTFVHDTREQFHDRILAVALFGSKARGDDDPESDIDLIVIADSEDSEFRSALWRIASEISLEYNVIISARIYSKKRWEKTRRIGLPFSKAIINESIPLTLDRIPI